MKNRTALRCILGLLALVTVLSCFTACSKKNGTPTGTKPGNNPNGTVTKEELKDGLPDTDMDGFVLTLLNYTDAGHGYSLKTMVLDGDSDDMIDSAIYRRNLAVEQRFHCYIEEQQQDRPYDNMRQNAIVGNAGYDVALMYEEHINQVLIADPTGLMFFEDIPNLNLSQPYWNQDANDVYSINGHQYAGVGDWCLSMYSKVYCYFLNKNVYRQVSLEEDVYDLVRSKKWTIEKLFEVGELYTQDIDGENGWTAGDRYGIVGASKMHFQLLLTGAGLKFVDKDENGAYALALSGDYASNIIDLTIRLSSTPTYYNNLPDTPNGSIVTTEFKEDRALLLAATLQNLQGVRKDVDETGVLPAPLLNSEQENYKSIAIGGLLTCFPSTLKEDRKEYTGMLVEALCCASYNNVIPVYQQELLKSQSANSPDDADMMDILFTTTTYDLGCSTWASSIRLPIIKNIFHPLNNNYTGMLTILSNDVSKSIADTVEAVERIAENRASGT